MWDKEVIGLRFKYVGLCLVALALIAACGGQGNPGSFTSGLPDSPVLKSIQANGSLRVGVAVALPWLGQDPQTNKYFGPATLIAEEMAKRLNVKVTYVPEQFDTVIAAIQANKIDLAIAPLYATTKRLAVVSMTNWSVGGWCYLALKSNSKVNSLADLNSPNVTFANFEGTGPLEATKNKYPNAKQLVRAPAPGEIVDFVDVRAGKADIAVFDNPLANVYKEDNPDLKIIPNDCLTNPDMPTPVAVAYQKNDGGLKQFVDKLVSDIKPQLDASFVQYSDPKYLRT